MEWFYVLLIFGSYAVCVGFSAVFFSRFAKTRDRRALKIGLFLLFGVPGLATLAFVGWAWMKDETPFQNQSTCYLPAILSGPQPAENAELNKERESLEKKYGPRVSTETSNKLSGGIFDDIHSDVRKNVSEPGK